MVRLRYWFVVAGCLVACAVSCAISLFLSRRAFTGYDVSPMIDAGWRVFNGQAPGRDFIVTFPPSLYVSIALAYRLFGVTWPAIAKMECVLYAGMVLLGLRLARLVQRAWGEPAGAGTLISYFVGQTLLIVSINYPWHASMAQSFGLYAVMATLPLLGTTGLPRALRGECYLHLSLAIMLLLLSKPNTAFSAILFCVGVLFLCQRSWVETALSFGLGIVAAALVLGRAHTSIPQMLAGYSGLTGRLLPRGLTIGILEDSDPHSGLVSLVVYAIVAPLLTGLVAAIWRSRKTLRTMPAVLLGAGAVVISVLGMATNFDFKLTDSPLLLLGSTILVFCGLPDRTLVSRTTWATLALLLFALYIGRSRYRMMWAFEPCAPVWIQDEFLGKIKVCPALETELTEVDKSLAENPGAKVFFGPSLEFFYAARAVPSPAQLPNWWDPGTSYARRDTSNVVSGWEHDGFTLLVFQQNEGRVHLPQEISSNIDRNFERVGETQTIHVYRLRRTAPGGSGLVSPATLQHPAH